jgi:uncharacterized protein
MTTSASAHGPLTDNDLDRLDELLEALNPNGAMLLEELDGFFSALVAGPVPGAPGQHLDELLGLDEGAQPAFDGDAQRAELLALLERHWQSIDEALTQGEGFAPILMHDDEGRPGGNLWAIGFLRGISLAADAWEPVEDDPEMASLLEPFETLAEELDLETGETVNPVEQDERRELIDAMAEAAFAFHEYFAAARNAPSQPAPQRRH